MSTHQIDVDIDMTKIERKVRSFYVTQDEMTKTVKKAQSDLWGSWMILQHIGQVTARIFKKEAEARYASTVLETIAVGHTIKHFASMGVGELSSGNPLQIAQGIGHLFLAAEMTYLRAQMLIVASQQYALSQRQDSFNGEINIWGIL
jgi:hypothetical protein